MSKLNKIITNKPVVLTNEEVRNLSETLSAVRTAGGSGEGGHTYVAGDDYISVNNTQYSISLSNKTTDILDSIPSAVSSFPDANDYAKKNYVDNTFQTKDDMSAYWTSEETTENFAEVFDVLVGEINGKQNKLTFSYDNDKISAINGSALAGQGGVTGDYYSASNPSGFINSTQADTQILAKNYITSSVSVLDNFYSKTDTSSKTEIESAFDNLPKYILNGDSNITATSAEDGNNIRWDLAVKAHPTVTDTTLTGEHGIYTHPTHNSGEWCVEIVQSAYAAINDVHNKLDTTAAAQTYQPIGDYVSATDITDMATQSWVSGQAYLQTVRTNSNAGITGNGTEEQPIGMIPNFYTKSETSGAAELSAEFAKYIQDISTSVGITGNGETYPLGLDTTASLYMTNVSAKSAVSAEKANRAEYITNGVGYSGFDDISAKFDSLSSYVPFSATELPIGTNNIVSNYSIGIGYNNSANYGEVTAQQSQYGSISFGYQNSASKMSFAAGNENKSLHVGFAVGYRCSATEHSIAMNNNCSANDYSFAEGNNNKANKYSFAGGLNCSADDYSFAYGDTTSAIGKSFAYGPANKAYNNSYLIGRGLEYSGISTADYNLGAFVIGGWNATTSWSTYSTTPLFIIGNGGATRSDAFVVYRNGAIKAGSNTSANESNSVAFGSLSQASGNCAFVAGAWSYAIGQGAHAEGNSCGTTGYGNHIQGSFNLFESTGAAYNGPSNIPVFVGGTLNATTAQDYSDHGGYLQIMGNGTYQGQGSGTRCDAYILYRDGTVKAKDFIAGGDTLSANYPVPKSVPNTADNSLVVQRMFVCTSDAEIVAHAALSNGEGCIFFRVG